jgi:hypothetical protein
MSDPSLANEAIHVKRPILTAISSPPLRLTKDSGRLLSEGRCRARRTADAPTPSRSFFLDKAVTAQGEKKLTTLLGRS